MENKKFKNLISLAKQESVPLVDVADNVISVLNALAYKKQDPYRAYTWIGTASAAIAACFIFAITMLWQSNSDSVSEIITYVSWVTQ
jgi:hypothetical protein